MEFERRVEVTPSYCAFHKEDSQNFGISGCRMVFYVIGPKGAVQWMIGTNWYVKAARDHLAKFSHQDRKLFQPEGWDLGYHAREPHYEGQSPMKDCHLLGGDCYYGGSGLNAEDVVEGFLARGTDWLWPKLEEYYRYIFEGGSYPDWKPDYITQKELAGKRKKRAA